MEAKQIINIGKELYEYKRLHEHPVNNGEQLLFDACVAMEQLQAKNEQFERIINMAGGSQPHANLQFTDYLLPLQAKIDSLRTFIEIEVDSAESFVEIYNDPEKRNFQAFIKRCKAELEK